MILVNPTNGPLVFTDDARTIGAGERLSDVQPDDTTRTGLARGYLVEVTPEQARIAEDTSAGAPEPGGEPAAAPGVADPKPAG
jgi:hypothetical protein